MSSEGYRSEPNLIAEAYRNQADVQIPRRTEKHLDFLEISGDGLFLLGTSNLCGRIWSGSIWIYDVIPSTADVEKSLAGLEFETGLAAGLWRNSNTKLVVGSDNGSLHYLSLMTQVGEKEKNYLATDGIVTEHDDSVTALDGMNDRAKIISGGMDMNIKVWDEETLISEKSYCPAHGHIVTSVSSQCKNTDTFASTSLDGTSLVWDVRLEKPASLLMLNNVGYTASCWIDENTIALGSNDGSISLVDLRTKEELNRCHCSQRPIFRLKYNPDLELLAVCADDPIVRVFDAKDKCLENKYECQRHTDFVRGLAWDIPSKTLYSCSWDGKIYVHNVTN